MAQPLKSINNLSFFNSFIYIETSRKKQYRLSQNLKTNESSEAAASVETSEGDRKISRKHEFLETFSRNSNFLKCPIN